MDLLWVSFGPANHESRMHVLVDWASNQSNDSWFKVPLREFECSMVDLYGNSSIQTSTRIVLLSDKLFREIYIVFLPLSHTGKVEIAR